MIHRILEDKIRHIVGGDKAIIVMGARQVGKSTLLKSILGSRDDVLASDVTTPAPPGVKNPLVILERPVQSAKASAAITFVPSGMFPTQFSTLYPFFICFIYV